MKNEALVTILSQIREIGREQTRIISESNIGEKEFFVAVDRYQEARLFAKIADADKYRESLTGHGLSDAEIKGMIERFQQSRKRPPEMPSAAIVQYAANLERARMLQQEAGLSPEKFADAYREFQWDSLMASKEPPFPYVGLESAKSLEEHKAILRQHGFMWWWRLKGGELWNSRIVMDTITINGHEHRVARQFSVLFRYRFERSAFEYERLARVKEPGKEAQFEFGKPWCALTPQQMEELAQRWPMPDGNLIPYIWRTAHQPWPNETILAHQSFDLRQSDDALAKEFKEIIRVERQRLGVLRTPRTGHRTKSYPWRQLELLDLIRLKQYRTENGETTPDETDRSRLSKARRGSKRL